MAPEPRFTKCHDLTDFLIPSPFPSQEHVYPSQGLMSFQERERERERLRGREIEREPGIPVCVMRAPLPPSLSLSHYVNIHEPNKNHPKKNEIIFEKAEIFIPKKCCTSDQIFVIVKTKAKPYIVLKCLSKRDILTRAR